MTAPAHHCQPGCADAHPKPGDVVGDRTVINVRDTFLIFGKREGGIPNCGAYFTDYREWFAYEASQMPLEQRDGK